MVSEGGESMAVTIVSSPGVLCSTFSLNSATPSHVGNKWGMSIISIDSS